MEGFVCHHLLSASYIDSLLSHRLSSGTGAAMHRFPYVFQCTVKGQDNQFVGQLMA